LITKVARASSLDSSTSSLTTARRSNLERIGSVRSTLSLKFKVMLYVPLMGFAAAMTLHLACRLVMIPALEMEIVYCSMAS
jgi:hypothetical protein